MNYATVVFDLWSRFPNLETAYRAQFAYMGDEDPSPYIVLVRFWCLPWLRR